jgi:hypothetical protein
MLTKEQIARAHKLLPKDLFNLTMVEEGHPEEVCHCDETELRDPDPEG